VDRELLSLVADIRQLLTDNDTPGLKERLAHLHPADLAEVIEELSSEDGARVLALLDEENAAETLDDLESQTQRELLAELEAPKIAGILGQMADDDIADLVAELGTEQAEQVLGLMGAEDRQDIRQLMSYPEDSAGGIMTTEFVWVGADFTAEQAIDHIRKQASEVETINYIYVLDTGDKLCGVLSLRDLIVASPRAKVREFMETDLVVARVTEDQEEVARSAMHYDLLAMPVVDDQGRMLGIVTIDDLIDVIDEEAAEDFFGVAHGGPVPEQAAAGRPDIWARVKVRLPWLVLLIFGNFISANVMQRFEAVLASVVAIAFFVPVLLDSAGNVGTQSLAVTIRGMARRDIDTADLPSLIWQELRTGLALGVACGVVIAVVAGLWQDNLMLGLVVGGAMCAGLTVAAVMGVVVPIAFDRMGIDPAVASSPLITTIADVSALLIYFSLAVMWIEHLA
jgi:magnesium transporter